MIKGFCLCGSRRAKIPERILGEIKLETKHLSNSIVDVRKEINKGLLLGNNYKPTKRLSDWVKEAIAIELEANGVVKSAQQNSSFLEGGMLRNMLKKINVVLKKCPFDLGLRPVIAIETEMAEECAPKTGEKLKMSHHKQGPEVMAEIAAEFRSEQDYLGECNKNRLLAAAECFARAAICRRSAQGIRA